MVTRVPAALPTLCGRRGLTDTLRTPPDGLLYPQVVFIFLAIGVVLVPIGAVCLYYGLKVCLGWVVRAWRLGLDGDGWKAGPMA